MEHESNNAASPDSSRGRVRESGILPIQELRKAAADGIITSDERFPIPDSNFQPASLDLRLGETAYRLRCSFLPDRATVEEKLNAYRMEQIDLTGGAILEINRPYLIPLVEGVELPAHIGAKANPKSSTGRLDIFTRVITDQSYKFDEVANGYKGKLYLEVVSRSFTIKVKTGLSLNQLRLNVGSAELNDDDIRAFHGKSPVIFDADNPLGPVDLAISDGLFLSVNLPYRTNSIVGYRARKNSRLLDLSMVATYDASDFWEAIQVERGNRLVLEPEEFYLLISKEKVRIPPELASEMTAYDPVSGELRTHYAGFFDPGFGYDRDNLTTGSKAVMEVRAHDVPFMIEDGQRISKLEFEWMKDRPDILYGSAIGSSYQHQEMTLSKHFISVNPRNKDQLGLWEARWSGFNP
jgi:dCTP deaminase